MKHLKLFFALFAMLALGVGNAWGETYSLTPNKAGTGLNNTAYITSLTEFTNNGISWKMNQWNPSTLQIKTNQSSATSEWRFYNTSAIPGKITKVVIKFSALTLKSTTATGFKFVGGSTAVTATTGGTDGVWNASAKTLTWTPTASDNFTYFALYQNGKVATGTNKLATSDAIVVTYETSGNEETVPSLTQDQFSWSATTATATLPNTFDNQPTLTNTESLAVTYSSSNGEVATIDANGNVTLVGVGTADIKATAGDDITFKKTTVYYTLTVNKAPATPTDNVYVKVTTTAGITDGEYLIVYEDASNATPAPVAFNGDLATLDAAKNTVAVEISNSTIAGNTDIDVALFTIDVTAGTLKSASGKYIGVSSNNNGLKTEDVAKDYKNAFSVDDNGNAVIAADFEGSTMSLRYNNTAGDNNLRFRYYKNAGQQPIALYKKASKHIVTIADCTNGSVSAKMGETALATNDQVLSGIQITLSNEAATGYKLTAYDVYKTGDNTTKVTVTDGKFIMPEYDVTISATFELAKTLTGIEITNAATQNTFWQGETFNHNGLKVTAHFEGAEDEDVTSKITVTGSTATAGNQTVTVSYKEGEVTKDATYTITVKAIPNTKETAYTVADAFDIIDKLGDTDKMYITGFVSQADLEQSSIDQYKNADYWISADGTTNGQQLEAFRGKYLDNTDFTSVNQIMVGDEVIIYGKLTKYGSTYEFAAGNYLVSLKRDKQQPELSYTTTEYNVNLGEAFTAPTLNNTHNLTVTYSSNNEDVATVAADGAVTIKAAGTVKITASFAGNDDYVAGSASYTINITDPNQLEVTFDAADDKGNTTQGEGEIIKSPITFACSDGILGNGEEYRIYANAKAIFSAAEGYIITKVVLTSTASDDSKYGPANLSTEEGTYTYSGKVGTWVGEAYTVTLSASAQVRATTITVYYKQDNRVDAGIAWNPATVSLTVGDAFTAPKFSNPNSLTVSFESSNDALAIVSNAGVITLKDGVAGKATITALFKGNENYKPSEVTCTITVDHKSEDVVILAKCKDQYYALVAKYVDGKNDVLQALPVAYINGKIYNVATDEQKASITWKRVVVDGKTTFKNGDNYLSAVNSAALKLETTECEWVFEDNMYKIDGADRTIIYSATNGGFKNYALSNVSNDGISGQYSSLAQTVAPVFANQDAYHRCTTAGKFGTICLPFGSTNYTGAEFFECVGKEEGKVYLGSVTTLVAGTPYIFLASATEVAVYGNGTTAATPGSKNGLVGTFTNDTEVAIGNYILKDNELCQAEAICWVNANRAYLVMEDVPGEFTKMPGRRYIGMDVQGENVETGVEDLFKTDAPVKVIENGQLIIIRDGVKYNVQGQKL